MNLEVIVVAARIDPLSCKYETSSFVWLLWKWRNDCISKILEFLLHPSCCGYLISLLLLMCRDLSPTGSGVDFFVFLSARYWLGRYAYGALATSVSFLICSNDLFLPHDGTGLSPRCVFA